MIKSTHVSILSFNINKGKTLMRRSSIEKIAEALHNARPDILFLQEVVGLRARKFIRRIKPHVPQHLHLAGKGWEHSVYGENLVHSAGHHGNAILSKFSIVDSNNTDVSSYSFEKRGILSAKVRLPDGTEIYCLCLHFALFRKGRRKQIHQLASLVRATVPDNAALIIAGDFNDWRGDASPILFHELQVQEVFHELTGKHANSFPSHFPFLSLDRIYFRGLKLEDAAVLRLPGSDHRGLSATFVL